MKRVKKDSEVETSERTQRAGLRRIARRHVARPGETKLSDAKVKITLYVDADVLEYFKGRAARPHAAPYQTQINNELRAVMEQNRRDPYAGLVNDERFIAAVAARVKEAAKR
ncbi:MAG TPA: BrnA antitoxin family protein [Pyrinomonadaceae bacterium]|jgi:uncharacterized protein (DUF4415 family)